MKKTLTQEQYIYIQSIVDILNNVASGIEPIWKIGEYSYVEFTNDKKRYTISIGILTYILKNNSCDKNLKIYMDDRKSMFTRLVAGEKFIFGIDTVT